MDNATRDLLDARIEDIRLLRQTVAVTSNGGLSSSWLARVLSDNGFQVSPLTVQKHINRRCRCGY